MSVTNASAAPGLPLKSVGTAYILWATLGLLGGHHFYLGKTGRGVGYLLTIGWLGVGWLIDAFTLPSQVRMANVLRRGAGQAQAQSQSVNVYMQPPPAPAAPTGEVAP